MSALPPMPPAIVLVDDEPTVRIILCRLLEVVADGYEIITVGTGAEALAALAERSVPLLITDYNMPGMSGVELAQRVKGTSPTTTVVLISAYITAEVEQLSKAAGLTTLCPSRSHSSRSRRSCGRPWGSERGGKRRYGLRSTTNVTPMRQRKAARW